MPSVDQTKLKLSSSKLLYSALNTTQQQHMTTVAAVTSSKTLLQGHVTLANMNSDGGTNRIVRVVGEELRGTHGPPDKLISVVISVCYRSTVCDYNKQVGNS
jgi:hypothetical protein